MHYPNVTRRQLADNRPLSKQLAYQIREDYCKGVIAIVSDHPLALMSAVRKQWLKLIRQMYRERAGTLDRQQICRLEQSIWCMQNISFTATDPKDDPIAHISFATVEQFRLFPPMCATLYIITPVEKLDQYMLTSWMSKNGEVVIYGQN